MRQSRVEQFGRTVGILVAALAVAVAPALPSGQQAAGGPAAPAKTAPESAGVPDNYRIGAGDVLEINVWKEPEASVQGVTVRPDGKISLPLVKDLAVIGQTPQELQKTLTAKFSQFINGADVTVVVKEVRSKKVYLIGAVKKEGPVPLTSDMTVLQVLSEAGGVTEFAKKKKIYVLRTVNGKQVKFPFNLDAVVKGEHMEQNVTVLPDDTVVVPQ
jgi:polysaccharide export outer membrane protein